MTTSLDSTIHTLYPAHHTMKDKILANLFTHWEDLRQDRIAPARSELDPRAIQSALEYSFILEHLGDGDCRFRLAGAHICDQMGMELRAMPARSIIDVSSRKKFDDIIELMVQDPQIAEIRASSSNGNDARILLLPMTDQNGDMTRILGGIERVGGESQAPNRLIIKDAIMKRIVSDQPLALDSARIGFAEDQTDFMMPDEKDRPLKQSERPYLRLITDE